MLQQTGPDGAAWGNARLNGAGDLAASTSSFPLATSPTTKATGFSYTVSVLTGSEEGPSVSSGVPVRPSPTGGDVGSTAPVPAPSSVPIGLGAPLI